MNKIAFGTYRISEHNLEHIEALKEAIRSGVRLIDTSSNYTDGSAERAIALALREFEELKKEIKIVSKVGYIQGTNLQEYFDNPFNEVVKYSEECFHCISGEFIHDQLDKSLERLESEQIDCYLLHNPEYYILDAINNKIPKDNRLDEMYERIFKAFVALEEEVQRGRINSYGISSNSFSKNHNSDEFLPYEDLLILAQNAAEELGHEKHSFTTIELPINILETEGLACAEWAKEQGLRVLANRPLNAQYKGKMYRLAEYDESSSYYYYLNELLDACDNETLRPIYNLVEQLDESMHKFGWIGDFESFLYIQVIPHMRKSLQYVEEDTLDIFLQLIDMYINEYKIMVAHECSKKTREELSEYFEDCDDTMQACALKFLAKNGDIDYILVGMRKVKYVHEISELQL